MVNLESVSISCRRYTVSKPPFKKISIAETKLIRLETKDSCNAETIFVLFSSFERLSFNVRVRRNQTQVLSDSESRTNTESFVNWATDIATEAKRCEHVEVDLLGDWNSEHHLVPLLSVGLILSCRLGLGG